MSSLRFEGWVVFPAQMTFASVTLSCSCWFLMGSASLTNRNTAQWRSLWGITGSVWGKRPLRRRPCPAFNVSTLCHSYVKTHGELRVCVVSWRDGTPACVMSDPLPASWPLSFGHAFPLLLHKKINKRWEESRVGFKVWRTDVFDLVIQLEKDRNGGQSDCLL